VLKCVEVFVAECCGVLQCVLWCVACVAVCGTRCVAVCCGVMQSIAECFDALKCVLQRVLQHRLKCVSVGVAMCSHTQTHTHSHTHANTHTQTHTHTHTLTHTFTHTHSS